jgi:hypothetical protein
MDSPPQEDLESSSGALRENGRYEREKTAAMKNLNAITPRLEEGKNDWLLKTEKSFGFLSCPIAGSTLPPVYEL